MVSILSFYGVLGCTSGGSFLGAKCEACSGEAESAAILALVNDPSTTFEILDIDAGLRSNAASNIIDHRDGEDREPGSQDDDLFDTLDELDDVPQVGPSALEALLEYAIANGYLSSPFEGSSVTEVVFSPQYYDESHLARVVELIDDAEYSLDIAMYSFGDSQIFDAIDAAVQRGVDVRMVFDEAYDDAREDDLEDTESADLETIGVNVRYINKIMHHKFVIVDGPRDVAERASTCRISSGSGNWSYSAGTKYDENTLFMEGVPEVALLLQDEFNLMWEHSRDFLTNESLAYELSTLEITEANTPDIESTDVIFTSANMDPRGTTFYKDSSLNTVSDAWVEAINNADSSIHIASGHYRSRPIAEALEAKKVADPSIDIRILLDGQEYISAYYHSEQLDDLADCLADASTETQTNNCYDKGFYFSYQSSEESDIELRFKFYAYKWDYTYADQMHHKYMIIDGDELYTGSYNLSNNAEHNTFENTMVFTGAEFQHLSDAYEANFEELWTMGEADGLYDSLMDEVNTADQIPVVFDSMALTWQEVADLKSAIYANCPSAYSDDWYTSSNDYSCTRE